MKSLILFALLAFPLTGWAQTGLSDQWLAYHRAGAPNSNMQCFTPNNVSVQNGNLVIVTRLEDATCSSIDLPSAIFHYTSGFVAMRRFNFLYGTVEFRAKFGGGQNTGSWPCVWMFDSSCQASDPTGTDDRCNGQEIDIAEFMHGDFSHVNEQIHVNGFAHNEACTPGVSDASKNFHTYRMDWSRGLLTFQIDGKNTCKISKPYIPSGPMYLKVDSYVGGYGGPIRKKSLPWTSEIDYFKVTQGSKVIFFDDFNGTH